MRLRIPFLCAWLMLLGVHPSVAQPRLWQRVGLDSLPIQGWCVAGQGDSAVAVSIYDATLSIDSGKTWTKLTGDIANRWKYWVLYERGCWFAMVQNRSKPTAGDILRSRDAIHWDSTTVISSGNLCSGSQGLFCAGWPNDRLRYSSDSGQTWIDLATPEHDPTQGIGPFAMGDVVLLQLHAGTTSHLAVSSDLGQTWTYREQPSATCVILGANDSVIFAFDSIGFYRSLDTGRTWQNCAKLGWLSQYDVQGNALVVCSNDHGILASFDGGLSWRDFSDGILGSKDAYSISIGNGQAFVSVRAGPTYRCTLSEAMGVRTSSWTTSAIGLRLEPNPASSVVRISSDDTGLSTFRITLIDALGRTYSPGKREEQNSTVLDLADLPVGAYTLCVSSPSAVATQRILVTR